MKSLSITADAPFKEAGGDIARDAEHGMLGHDVGRAAFQPSYRCGRSDVHDICSRALLQKYLDCPLAAEVDCAMVRLIFIIVFFPLPVLCESLPVMREQLFQLVDIVSLLLVKGRRLVHDAKSFDLAHHRVIPFGKYFSCLPLRIFGAILEGVYFLAWNLVFQHYLFHFIDRMLGHELLHSGLQPLSKVCICHPS